jgi:hypothetical protein
VSGEIDFVGLGEKINEIPVEYAGFMQIQNLSPKMLKVTNDAYLLSRASALVKADNEKVLILIDKGLVLLVETPAAKAVKHVEKPKSRKKVKKEIEAHQDHVLKNLSHLFEGPDKNVRQTP